MRCSSYEGLSMGVLGAPACGGRREGVRGSVGDPCSPRIIETLRPVFPKCGWWEWVRTWGWGEGWRVVRWAVPTALGQDAESADFQAPMRAAGWHPPPRGRTGRRGTAGLCAQSGNPRSSVLDGPKRQAPTTLNRRRTVRSASCRASIRGFTVGKGLRIAFGTTVGG